MNGMRGVHVRIISKVSVPGLETAQKIDHRKVDPAAPLA